MSRTKRNIDENHINCAGVRTPRHHRNIVMEVTAIDEITEYNGRVTHNRLRNYGDRIVTNYDDIAIAGLSEKFSHK